jgi:uncharacterized membrane protein (UPF0127 family)
MKYIRITNQTNQKSVPIIAGYCQSFLCQLRGLMFTKSLPENHGLLLVQSSESKLSSSIHMMFMWMDLAVIWINNDYTVVDLVLARRWRLAYYPKKPAKHILETSVSHLHDFNLGDKVHFETVTLDKNE